MRGWASPVTEILVFATEITVNGLEIVYMNTPARGLPGLKLENSLFVHLGNRAEISYI